MSPMAQSFWSENRRVSNHKLCHELGYTLLHPDYRVGLQDCLHQDKLNPSDRRFPFNQPTVEIKALALLRHGKTHILKEAGEVQFDPAVAQT